MIMNVTCGKCNTSFELEENRTAETGEAARCPRCDSEVPVLPEGSNPAADPGVAALDQGVLELSRNLDSRRKKSATEEAESPVFTIVKDDGCPLYQLGDDFQLSGKIFKVPPKKAPCLILAKDVVKILARKEPPGDPDPSFNCSGCTGIITFKHRKTEDAADASSVELQRKSDSYIGAVINLLRGFNIFKNLGESEIRDLVAFLRLEKFTEDDVVIRKGEPGRNLYIIVSGKVEVVSDDGMSIAFMGTGDVFGEMSLLSGDPVGATIKVVEPSTLLYIGSKDFKRVLNELPTLQLNFTRLLARRMAEINLARSEEFASGMTGKLSEMPPAELFQTLNVNQKTGVLTLKFAKESAYLSFREGELIGAKFRNLEGQNAFFELLKIKEGRFKFIPGLSPEEMEAPEVGDFMHLLMEGLRKIDEDDKNFLRTMIPNLT